MYEETNRVNDLIKITKKLFTLNIIVATYISLSILSITDTEIILNEAIRLPIFNIEINLMFFFYMAPVTLIILFTNFYLHLRNTINEVDRTKRKFNSRSHYFPWINMEAINDSSNSNNDLNFYMGILSIWWILPITNLLIIYKILFTHEDGPIIGIALIIIASNLLVLQFFTVIYKINSKDILIRLSQLLMAIAVAYFIYSFCGVKPILKENNIRVQHIFPFVIGFFVVSTIILNNLRVKSKIKTLDRNLVISWLTIILSPIFVIHYVFLANTDEMKNVDLSYLNLSVSIGSDQSYFYNINLYEKRLEGANLTRTNLRNADLRLAHLEKSSLAYAILDESDMEHTKLNGADLRYASLLGVKNLRTEQLEVVFTLYETLIDSTMKSELLKSHSHLFVNPENE